MAALTGRNVRDSYIELLKLNTASTNTGVTGSLIDVTDGGNTASALSISTSQIASTVDGSAGTAAFTRKSDTDTGVFFPAANTIAFTTNGTECMRIDSSGNVGIGSTTPAGSLDIKKAGYAIFANPAASQTPASAGLSIGYNRSSGNGEVSLVWGAPASTYKFQIESVTGGTITPRMTIDTTGNVGIGETSPAVKLHVDSTGEIIRSETTSTIGNNYLTFHKSGGTRQGYIGYAGASNDVLTINNERNEDIYFYTNGTFRMLIGATGNVGIGSASPSAQLQLSTDSAKKPSTNTWTIDSDERLKTNIVDADKNRCYEIVKQVPLKRYTWKSEVYSQDKVKDRSKLGWIAQDVEEVFPKAVGTSRFAYNQVFEDVVTPELDSDGNAVFNEDGVAKTKTEKRLVSEEVIEDCKDLNSDQMYAAMYGTIQKLIEKVETLEAKVLALEAA